jgi:hypothetical protein
MHAIVSRPAAKPAALESLALARFKAIVLHRTLEQVAEKMGSRDDVLALHTRADQTAGSTTVSGWASQLGTTAFGAYLASLPASAAAKIIGLGLQVPMGPSTGFIAPKRNTAPSALPWVAELDPIPVRSFDFLGLTLTPKKMAAISVISGELARRAGGDSTVRQLLREDGEYALDSAYFSTTAASSAAHAGLLNGLTAITGYSGGDGAAFEADVSAILAAIGPRNSGSIVYVTGMAAAERIALKFPLFKSPVYGSQAVSDTVLIGIDAGSLVHSFGDFEIDASKEALVHMSDAPAEIVSGTGPTTADPTRSLFQTDSIGIRIIGEIAFGARKADAIAYVSGTTW